MMASGLALGFLVIMKESYEPAILQQRSQKRRKAEDDDRYWSRYDTKLPFIQLMKTNLSRPFIMALTEPICMFWNLYVSTFKSIHPFSPFYHVHVSDNASTLSHLASTNAQVTALLINH